MSENKTRPTELSVEAYLAAIEDKVRREDCRALATLMSKATKQPAKMWGSSIVGFGSYHYRYESGREGDSCVAGFASRKGDISLYLMTDPETRDELLAALGKHKAGKGCIYVRRMVDIDAKVLAKLVAGSVAEARRRYG
jgi:hypothetical protein